MTDMSQAVTQLARIILPHHGDPLDVRKLYVEESTTNSCRAHPLTRTSLQLAEESEVSFATYFNAFPASYWRRWSSLDSVILKVEITGQARIDVYRSKATGARISVDGRVIVSKNDHPVSTEFDISLRPFEDGGWIWFDITTDTPVTLLSAGWYASRPFPGKVNIAVGIPTFNRPDDCVNALTALTSDPLIDQMISAVIVPDQGTRKVRDHPHFPQVSTLLGQRLKIYDQPNLGGSGGYSRVMYEALHHTDAEQILFMDDDIRIEPDSILRALAFNQFAKNPLLVGGQMLNLQEPSHLHVMGEVVDRTIFMWTNAPHTEYDHNFATDPLSETPDLHRRIDVDFNGWWMCMIPRTVAQQLGQPIPSFIKWDDAEYGLRAREHGYPTVTLPGTAIWHMAWSDKDDAIDWQAYFHLRNRLMVAALHWDGEIRGLLASHLKATLKHLACLEYSTVAIQNQAIDDFLAGPDHLLSILESALPTIRSLRAQYSDAIIINSATDLPAPSGRIHPIKPPSNIPTILYRLTRGILHNLKPTNYHHHQRPQLNIPTQDARWYLLCTLDGATVTTADSSGVFYRKRDRSMMFHLLYESLRRQRKIYRHFDQLRTVYRQALPMLSSPQVWEKVLGIHHD